MYANIAAIRGEDILSVVNSGKLIFFREIKVINGIGANVIDLKMTT